MRKGKKNESVRASGKEWVDWWMDGWAGQREGKGDCTRLLHGRTDGPDVFRRSSLWTGVLEILGSPAQRDFNIRDLNGV